MNMTVLEKLIDSIKKASAFNQTIQVSPAAVLWTDKERQWEAVVPLLKGIFSQLLVLGEYAPESRSGPAIWLKCMIARTLPEADWTENTAPILYLPDVSRMELRAIESCPAALQPLAELQYRGTFWSQKNGRDWTLYAFLKSVDGGVGLDVAHDDRTVHALRRAFLHILEAKIDTLQGKRLEANDFNMLLTGDPVSKLLRWMDDPTGVRNHWISEEWEAYVSLCKSEYSFNPVTEGELTGAEKLAHRQGKWLQVWQRYAEAPQLYPKITELLGRTSPPSDLFEDKSAWPQINEAEESDLRFALGKLMELTPSAARTQVLELEKRHGERRSSVWGKLGQAPLAMALEHCADAARGSLLPIGGDTLEEMTANYEKSGWQVDRAALDALSGVTKADDVKTVKVVLQSFYKPWLEDTAFRLQELVAKDGYTATAIPDDHQDGDLVLFVDGLRFDIGQLFVERLRMDGYEASLASTWSALPPVTSTAKPGVSPVAGMIVGAPDNTDFVPNVAENGKPLSPYHFKKLLEDGGWQLVAKGEYGLPGGKGWAEFGDLDHFGHEHGWKLTRHIGDHLNELLEYVAALFNAGWARIRVVTDHGWLLLPGGLPKAELPKCLTETRWGRCAMVKESATIDNMIVPWHWCTDVRVALAPGIGCFTSGKEYDHGGISFQECLIPVVTITQKVAKTSSKIKEHAWKGLRCNVTIDGNAKGSKVDIRTKPADATSSVAKGGKVVEDEHSASLIVEDDGLIGTAAMIVLVDQSGAVVSKTATTIGGDK